MSRRLKLKLLYYSSLLGCMGIAWWVTELSHRLP